MKVPTKEHLIHLQIQAAMRENEFGEQLKYLGERVGHHWYLVGGKHEVRSDQFESFEILDDE
jgi:hypothetical protein